MLHHFCPHAMKPLATIAFLATTCLFAAPDAKAELQLEWARALGGTGLAVAHSIAVDGAGNVYTVGAFSGTVDFNPGGGVFELTSAGSDDIFVSKLDADGNFVWARRMGGTGSAVGLGIAVDGAGNVHTTGTFQGTVDFNPGGGVFELTAQNDFGTFVCKLDAGGDFVWAAATGGTQAFILVPKTAIALDGAGNVYTVGGFVGTADFDPGPGVTELTPGGERDMFVWKLDAGGNFVWARQMVGDPGSVGQPHGVALDDAGNVYTTGWFFGTADFNPDPNEVEQLTSLGYGGLTSKLNTNGDFVWARQVGGQEEEGGVVSEGIAVDGAGNVHTTGTIVFGTVDFNPDPDEVEQLTALGYGGITSKLDTNGDFVWARQVGGQDELGADIAVGLGIALDDAGNVYTTGLFAGTVDFDPGEGVFELIDESDDELNMGFSIFVSKLDADGNFVWAGRMGGSEQSSSRGLGIVVDSVGNVYTTGLFAGTVDFDPGEGVFELTAAGSNDAFVVKLGKGDSLLTGLTGTISDTAESPLSCAAVELIDSESQRFVAVTDSNGEYFFEPLPAGTYEVRVVAPGFETATPNPILLNTGEERTLNFALAPGAVGPVVAGQVTDDDTGEPLVGALVELLIGDAVVADTLTCADGRYEILLTFAKEDGLLDIELRFSLPNYETETVQQSIDPAQGVTVNEALQKNVIGLAALAGSVSERHGGDSVPLEGARITLRGPINASTSADDEGLYFFDTLLEGSYIVTASAPDFKGSSVRRNLEGGVVREANFVLLSTALPGDINGDGVVNAVDVQLVINAALGIEIEGGMNADINGDGLVNAVDVQLVINVALGIEIAN